MTGREHRMPRTPEGVTRVMDDRMLTWRYLGDDIWRCENGQPGEYPDTGWGCLLFRGAPLTELD